MEVGVETLEVGVEIDFDLHERWTFKVRDSLVIQWCVGNLIASPYFP